MTSVASVQGTVRNFDPATRSGVVLLDDGSQVSFAEAAFAKSGLRLLRSGQRLRLRVDSSGVVTAVSLVSTPLAR